MTSTHRIICMLAITLGAAGARAGTDLTIGEARLVRDLRPGPESSIVSDIVVAGGVAITRAHDGETVRWVRSDGTTEGTVLGTPSERILHAKLFSLGDAALAYGSGWFQSYNPTTGAAITFWGGTLSSGGLYQSPLLPFGDRLVYFRADTIYGHTGKVCAATAYGFKPITQSTIWPWSVPPLPVVTPRGVLIAEGWGDGNYGILRTDGTLEGTEFFPSPMQRPIITMGYAGETDYGFVYDRESNGIVAFPLGETGQGSPGVRLFAGCYPEWYPYTAIGNAGPEDRMLVLVRCDGGHRAVMAWDPATGSEELIAVAEGARVRFLRSEDRTFVLVKQDGFGLVPSELWATGGTPATTRLVDVNLTVLEAKPVGGLLMLTVRGDDGLDRIFASRGRGNDLRELAAFPGESQPGSFCAIGDQVLFTAALPETGRELFRIPLSVVQGGPLQPGDDNGDRVTDAADALAVPEAAAVVLAAAP
jgi:hypothetical protein